MNRDVIDNDFMWVDPPSGWKYGFPKLWNQVKHPDMRAWMTLHGYPDDGAEWRNRVRCWDATRDEVRRYGVTDNPESA